MWHHTKNLQLKIVNLLAPLLFYYSSCNKRVGPTKVYQSSLFCYVHRATYQDLSPDPIILYPLVLHNMVKYINLKFSTNFSLSKT